MQSTNLSVNRPIQPVSQQWLEMLSALQVYAPSALLIPLPSSSKLASVRVPQPSRPTRGVMQQRRAVDNAQMAETKKDDVVGEVVTPSLFNKPWVRSVGVLATLWLASNYVTVPVNYQKLVHLFSFSGWFGSTVWVIFLSPKLTFQSMTRQTFGKLQSKLFPQYFGFCAAMIVLLLATNPLQGIPYLLISVFLGNALNWLSIGPTVSALSVERYGLENAETRDEEKISLLRKKSSKFHALSSTLALIVFLCGTAHGLMISSLF